MWANWPDSQFYPTAANALIKVEFSSGTQNSFAGSLVVDRIHFLSTASVATLLVS